MGAEITWHGHACWQLKYGSTTYLLDPFLDESPVAKVRAADLHPDYILVSHGHFDHIADAAAIANRTGATVLSNYEITTWLASQHGVKNTIGMNLGGGTETSAGRVQLTVAHHSSQLPDGSYGGNPGGFLLSLGKLRIYFACDTSLFGDMALIGRTRLDLAVLPIGDLFTMGPDDALEAVKLLRPRYVLPSHFNTWPPIAQNPRAWADRVLHETHTQPRVLAVGESFTIPAPAGTA